MRSSSRLLLAWAWAGCSESEPAAPPDQDRNADATEVVRGHGEPPINADGATLTTPGQLRVVEYPIPSAIGACSAAQPFPHDPAVDDATGLVYFTATNESCIGQLNPETLEFRAWPTATPDLMLRGLVVAQGVVYFTGPSTNVLGRVDPLTGAATEFPLAMSEPHTPTWQAGAVWFTGGGGQFGRFDPGAQVSQIYDFSSDMTGPYGISPAPDGSVWVALFGTNRLARIDTSTSPPGVEELELPATGARPRRIAVDARGIVWYTDHARARLGSMDPSAPEGERFEELVTPGGGRPYGIAIGPDGRVWYNEQDRGQIVGFDQASKSVVAELPLPTANPGPVRNMDVDETRQRIWLALSDVGRLAVIQF